MAYIKNLAAILNKQLENFEISLLGRLNQVWCLSVRFVPFFVRRIRSHIKGRVVRLHALFKEHFNY